MASYNSRLVTGLGLSQHGTGHDTQKSTDHAGTNLNSDSGSEYDSSQQHGQGDGASTEGETPITPKTIKKRLQCHLDEVGHCGLIACGEDLKNAPNPGLRLKGFDDLRFPLGPNEITLLKSAAGQDNRNPDVESSAVPASSNLPVLQRVWEIASAKWEITNEAWVEVLDRLRTKICSQFGLGEHLTLSPLSLILQDAEGNVKLFDCSTPTSSSFGYVNVVLPSKHKGGDFSLSHGGKTLDFPTSHMSRFDCSWFAALHDVDKSSEPLVSGQRLILQYTFGYSLDQQTYGSLPSAAGLSNDISKLQSILKDWFQEEKEISYLALVYPFDNPYQQASLSQQMLVGKDGLVVSQLQEACASVNFHVCLATIEMSLHGERGDDYHQMQHPYEIAYAIVNVSEVDGNESFPSLDLPIEGNDILDQYDLFSESELYMEDTKYYPRVIRKYREKAVLIMPRKHRIQFFLGKPGTTNYAESSRRQDVFRIIQNYVIQDGQYQDEGALFDVMGALSIMFSGVSWALPKINHHESEILTALKAVIKSDDDSMLERALPLFFSRSEYFELLKSGSSRYGTQWFMNRLSSALSRQTHFASRLNLLVNISRLMRNRKWASAQVNEAVSSLIMSSEADGKMLGKLIEWVEDDVSLKTIVLPSLIEHARYAAFILAFLKGTTSLGRTSNAHVDIIVAVLSKTQIWASGLPSRATPPSQFKELVKIISLSYDFALLAQLDEFIARLETEVSAPTSNALGGSYLPFMAALIPRVIVAPLKEHAPLQQFCRTVLNAFITDHIPAKPSGNWSRSKRGCGCNDCITLDGFLSSKDLLVKEFNKDINFRAHLKSRLANDIQGKSITTGEVLRGGSKCLRVEKIDKSYDNELKVWRAKGSEKRGKMLAIGAKNLEALLGRVDYDRLLAMKRVAVQPKPPKPSPSEASKPGTQSDPYSTSAYTAPVPPASLSKERDSIYGAPLSKPLPPVLNARTEPNGRSDQGVSGLSGQVSSKNATSVPAASNNLVSSQTATDVGIVFGQPSTLKRPGPDFDPETENPKRFRMDN